MAYGGLFIKMNIVIQFTISPPLPFWFEEDEGTSDSFHSLPYFSLHLLPPSTNTPLRELREGPSKGHTH